MSRRCLRISTSVVLGLMAALGPSSCAGTPLPEPPDGLPRPEFTSFESGPRVVAEPVGADIAISAGSGAVQPNTRVSLVNLDAPGVDAVEVVAGNQGQFTATITAAVGDRVRILSRTDRAHSPPLDLVVLAATDLSTGAVPIAPLGDTTLPCLRISSTTLGIKGIRGELRVVNQCGVSVALTRAALRFGDAGIQLAQAPAQLAAGAQIALTFEDTQAPGDRERLDILLLDVAAADGRTGRYAIDVFSDVE